MTDTTSRARRPRVWVGVLAVAVLWVFTGVLPVLMYLDAHTVPSGVETSRATVTGYDPITSFRAQKRGYGGRIAQVEVSGVEVSGVEVGASTDRVHLDRRLDYPEAGDTLRVYSEDGVLRTTSEVSLFTLTWSLLALVAWPAITIGYLRSLRRSARWRARRPG